MIKILDDFALADFKVFVIFIDNWSFWARGPDVGCVFVVSCELNCSFGGHGIRWVENK